MRYTQDPGETWFEVKIEHDLAYLLQRIINFYNRLGKARRAEFVARVSASIADPEPAPEIAVKESGEK